MIFLGTVARGAGATAVGSGGGLADGLQGLREEPAPALPVSCAWEDATTFVQGMIAGSNKRWKPRSPKNKYLNRSGARGLKKEDREDEK